MNNNPIADQTQILIDLISTHYQYYYQQSIEIQAHHKVLPVTFYQDFIDNLMIELCHIDFAFPMTANIGYVMTAEQISRCALYWRLAFNLQDEVNNSFTCTLELMAGGQQTSDFKLICENGTSFYSKDNCRV
ncbi:hypothetical protein [Moritella dasanensis]|uniref:hypothetical protein n=1 Tax=Moritella dasanensis TaxID=428031 RepID=UPI00037CFE1C|nr:hypothetical protein [Moritella dasanensis]